MQQNSNNFYNFFFLKLSVFLHILRNSIARGRENGNAHARRRVGYAVKVVASTSSASNTVIYSEKSMLAIFPMQQSPFRGRWKTEKKFAKGVCETKYMKIYNAPFFFSSHIIRFDSCEQRRAKRNIMSAEISFGRIAQLINKRIQRSMPSIKALTRTERSPSDGDVWENSVAAITRTISMYRGENVGRAIMVS